MNINKKHDCSFNIKHSYRNNNNYNVYIFNDIYKKSNKIIVRIIYLQKKDVLFRTKYKLPFMKNKNIIDKDQNSKSFPVPIL